MDSEVKRAYLHAAAFTQDPEPGQGEYPEPTPDEYDPEFVRRAETDCTEFLDRCEKAGLVIPDEELDHAGRDFWYTRNGHGCGFWDGDWPEPLGDALDTIAKRFGEVYDQVFADGRDMQTEGD